MRGFTLGHSLFLVTGESMRPTLRQGDLVLGAPVCAALLKRGDIVVFTDGEGRRVIHRVVGTRPLRTQGDNRLAPDPPVPPSSSLWRVTHLRQGERSTRLRSGATGWCLFRQLLLRKRLETDTSIRVASSL